MTPDKKAELWIKIFGITPTISARTGVPEAPGLAGFTSQPKWDEWEPKPAAKAIGLVQWQNLFALAEHLEGAITDLPDPTPGADPLGFVWLTYRTTDGRELALEQHPDLTKNEYRWEQTIDGFKSRHECTNKNIRPLIECLRVTFGQTAADRRKRETLDIDRNWS